MIIAIANSKGGVGKSTVAVHLAAWLFEQGHSVTLADCDTQQSSSEWIREAAPQVNAVRLNNPDEILNELPLLNQNADFVVADGPGSQTETSRALLLRADLAIVPCKASMLEVRALAKATDVLRQAQDIRARQAPSGDRAQHGRQELPPDQGHEGGGLCPRSAVGLHPLDPAADLRRRAGTGRGGVEAGSARPRSGGRSRQLFREILPDACAKKTKHKNRRGFGRGCGITEEL